MSHQIGEFKRQMGQVAKPGPGEWMVLSLKQPWASAMFSGPNGKPRKTVETRSWQTNYRGLLYIHAALTFPKQAKDFAVEEGMVPDHLPLGTIIGSVDLVDIQLTQDVIAGLSSMERRWGNFEKGRYAWITGYPTLLPKYIPAVGRLGLWKYKYEVKA